MITRGEASIPQVLVKWSDQPASLATWEDYFDVRSLFPGAAAWGQAASEGEGDVTASTTTSPTSGEPKPKRKRKPSHRFDPATWLL